MISSSLPLIVKLKSSPAESVAVTVPIAVWFSFAANVACEVKIGPSLLILEINTVTSFVTVSIPSVRDKVIEYDDFVA